MKIFEVKETGWKSEDLDWASSKIQEGDLFVFPTETVYGIGCLPKEESVKNIYALKGRDFNKPLAFHISDSKVVYDKIKEVPSYFEKFANRFWPGPITAILDDDRKNTVGFRYPQNDVFLELVSSVGHVVMGTSANLSGQGSVADFEDLAPELLSKVAFSIDSGKTSFELDSSVLHMQQDQVTVYRKGCLLDELMHFFKEIGIKVNV